MLAGTKASFAKGRKEEANEKRSTLNQLVERRGRERVRACVRCCVEGRRRKARHQTYYFTTDAFQMTSANPQQFGAPLEQDHYMEQEEEWEREGLLDPAWEKQQRKVGRSGGGEGVDHLSY